MEKILYICSRQITPMLISEIIKIIKPSELNFFCFKLASKADISKYSFQMYAYRLAKEAKYDRTVAYYLGSKTKIYDTSNILLNNSIIISDRSCIIEVGEADWKQHLLELMITGED